MGIPALPPPLARTFRKTPATLLHSTSPYSAACSTSSHYLQASASIPDAFLICANITSPIYTAYGWGSACASAAAAGWLIARACATYSSGVLLPPP